MEAMTINTRAFIIHLFYKNQDVFKEKNKTHIINTRSFISKKTTENNKQTNKQRL